IKEVYSGDIAAAVGLRNVTTGDTICDTNKPVVLESIHFPAPVISLAVEPKTKADQEKLGTGLAKLRSGDPTCRVQTDTDTGQPCVVENDITGGTIPKEFIKPIETGIREALDRGILAGFPVVDVKVRLYDGSYHEVDSSEMAFKIAGSLAFQEAAKKASPVLLEPIMKVEVVTPDDYTGPVTGDLSSRRGHLEGQISRGGTQIITAMVPLSNMFGYSTDLRSRTQGRATYTMHFEKYAGAPRNVSEAVVAKGLGKVE